MTPFNMTNIVVSPEFEISVIDIESLDQKLIDVMDKHFVYICEGNSNSDLKLVKKEVCDLFDQKKPKWIMGAIAEFFVHLYMKLAGFKQECLFLNLEEGSLKKGFDGFYSLDGEEWIMESKSGSIDSKGVSHSSKVDEAMRDMIDKVGGKGASGKKKKPNNPWKNAYSHASHRDVGTADNIRNNIKKLSDDFVNERYHSIDEFNAIPCGTVFLTGVWSVQKHDEIINQIKAIADKLKGKKVHAICVTQTSVDIFKAYIKLGV